MNDAERIAEIELRHKDALTPKLEGGSGLSFSEWHKYMREDIPYLVARLKSALKVVEAAEHLRDADAGGKMDALYDALDEALREFEP